LSPAPHSHGFRTLNLVTPTCQTPVERLQSPRFRSMTPKVFPSHRIGCHPPPSRNSGAYASSPQLPCSHLYTRRFPTWTCNTYSYWARSCPHFPSKRSTCCNGQPCKNVVTFDDQVFNLSSSPQAARTAMPILSTEI
ncbi:unnamed protein product, partial [Ectocarpus sp. 8 AP-2014]